MHKMASQVIKQSNEDTVYAIDPAKAAPNAGTYCTLMTFKRIVTISPVQRRLQRSGPLPRISYLS